ncbi:MAG: hypothetical protein KFB94_01815 [Methylophilaceae bacterium]|nr:MAG: hypothetical protein KFB94_01815 [Methylophilaceae bacterium]
MEPNKYKKNADIRPDSLMRTVTSTSYFILMLIGIIGVALDMFKEDGLFTQSLFYLFQSTMTMLFIPVIFVTLWLLNRWISTPNASETKKSGNLPMYIVMLLGVYYIFKFITTNAF